MSCGRKAWPGCEPDDCRHRAGRVRLVWRCLYPRGLKQQRVRRAGFAFVRTLEESGLHVRFDVAAVLGTKLEMHEDIF